MDICNGTRASLTGIADPTEDVDYAIGYLSGNARLWVISALDGGTTYESWDALKKALTSAYGPVHDQERYAKHQCSACMSPTSPD